MKLFLIGCFATECILVGYAVGKYRLDQKAINAVKAGTDEFIAYAKSVPPREVTAIGR